MTPHPRDRVLWWIGAAIHFALIVLEIAAYSVTNRAEHPVAANTLLVMIATSVVMGAVCVDLARKVGKATVRKPPFRRQM